MIKGRVEKSDFYQLGGERGGSAGVNYHFLFFYFFVHNVLKSFLDTKVFSSLGVGGYPGALGGTSSPPLHLGKH